LTGPRSVRLPDLTVEQASVLLDVLDALTAAVVHEYGQAIAAAELAAAHDDDDEDAPF
jgi:hypothetical protein